MNMSYAFTPGEDNVVVPFYGDVSKYSVTATNPTYTLTILSETNPPDPSIVFTNTMYSGSGSSATRLVAVRDANFWRPGMSVTVDSSPNATQDIDYVRLYQKTDGVFKEFLRLYSDGTLKLVPLPRVGMAQVCFGSSVVIGPVTMVGNKPCADIESINYRPSLSPRVFEITYRDGGSATMSFFAPTTNRATVTVTVNYTTAQPYCAFKSVYVLDGVSNLCERVEYTALGSNKTNCPVSDLQEIIGKNPSDWFFYRPTRGPLPQSAPDIRIIPN
jgi:hypothetical protein